MNLFAFVGNLTKDPESSVMSNGKTQTKFNIAINRPYKDSDGNQSADFPRITCYEKNAENAAKYLSKGRKVAVTGHVKTGSYDKDGQKIYTTDFIADKLDFLSSPQSDGQQAAPEAAPAPEPAPTDTATGYTQVSGDGLPF
jgi:single-strand DNA-binding protein